MANGRLVPPKAEVKQGPPVQAALEAPRIQPLTPLQTRLPLFEVVVPAEVALGIRLGNLTLHPRMETRIVWNDNILGRPQDGQKGDFIWLNKPGLDLGYKATRDISLTAYYQFGWNDYLDDVARDYLTHDAGMTLDWRNAGPQGLHVHLRDVYTQTGSASVLEDDYVSFNRLQANRVGPTVEYRTGQVGFEASYEYALVDYFRDELQEQDFHSHGTRALLYYEVSKSLVPYFRYEWSTTRFPNADGGTFDLHNLLGGVKARLDKFTFDFSAGNNRILNWNPYDSNDGPAAYLLLNYRHSSRIDVYFTAKYYLLHGVRTGDSTSTSFGAGGRFTVLPRFRVDGSLLWLQEQRSGGLVQRTTLYNAGFDYRIRRDLHAYAAYNRAERTSNESLDVTINQITLGLNFRF